MTKLSLILLTAAFSANAVAGEGEDDGYDDDTPCRLWMAPSSVSTDENPKMGLFAGVDFNAGEYLPLSELAIPLVDMFEDPAKQSSKFSEHILQNIENHVWMGDYAGAQYEGNYTTNIFVPGIGALSNYHTGVHNVMWSKASLRHDKDDGFTEAGKAHLSRGAITPYSDMTLEAARFIPAGMELFAFFGNSWDDRDKDPGIYQDKVTKSHYEEADKILDSLVEFMDKYDDEMTPELKTDIFDFILDKILAAAAEKRASVIRSLIPAHPDKLRRAQEMGGTFAWRNQHIVKKLEWLNDHGYCVDNIRAGISTIPGAGRGAFADLFLPRGSVIAPIPLQPIADKKLLGMYPFADTYDSKGDLIVSQSREGKPMSRQILLNYCFGHPESSLLLMPLAPLVTLVNHGSGKKANAYLKWSENLEIHDPELLNRNPFQYSKQSNAKLAYELMAMRDIEEGEEILIDYGPEWVKAWERYKTNWEKAHGSNDSWKLKARDLVKAHKGKPFPLHEIKGQDPDSYPEGVWVACFIYVDDVEDGLPNYNEYGVYLMSWSGPASKDSYSGDKLQVCDILSWEEDEVDKFKYTVVYYDENDDPIEVSGVPHAALTFLDDTYSSDIHEEGAFRHYIGLGNAIAVWPQVWENKIKKD